MDIDRKELDFDFDERGARGGLGTGAGFSITGCWDFSGLLDRGDRRRSVLEGGVFAGEEAGGDHQLAEAVPGDFWSAGSSTLPSEAADVVRSACSLCAGA